MDVHEQDEISIRLAQLREEHADLGSAIDALIEHTVTDQLRIARLKKRKLFLKDQISLLEARLIPDIIA